jgi:hypothetical protein
MSKKLLLSILLIATISSYAQNIDVSRSKGFNGECYLAANPKNPKHLITAWIHKNPLGKNEIATSTSFDGGVNWTSPIFMPHLYSNFGSPDPTMYFGKDSCVYLAFIDLSGLSNSDSGYIMVTRSVNGGITWRTPVKAIGWNAQPNLPIDRPWIATDASNGPYSGRVYLTSQNAFFTPQPHHPWFTFSTDSGLTWSPIKQLDDSIPTGNITDATAFMTVAANGTLYGAYFSLYTPYSLFARLVLVKSYNGGATFTTNVVTSLTSADAIPAADSMLKDGICISSDPADTSNLVIVGPSNHFGEPDIVSYNTHDAGATWNGPTRLNDDAMGAYDTAHDLTWAGFSASGTYAAVWRDRRGLGKGDTVPFRIYGAYSFNGGDSYSPNFRISDTISPFINAVHGDDFLGCAVTDSAINVSWCDKRTDTNEIFFNSTSFNLLLSVSNTSNNAAIKVQAYPNPFHDETNIVIHSAQSLKHCRLVIFSMDGKQSGTIEVPGNSNIIKYNSSLVPGTYVWTFMQGDAKLAEGKWIVQ